MQNPNRKKDKKKEAKAQSAVVVTQEQMKKGLSASSQPFTPLKKEESRTVTEEAPQPPDADG